MKRTGPVLAAILATVATPASAQQANAPALGEVMVTASRDNARYALQNRPVVGMRRQADSIVTQVTISSDSRDAETRKREIHAILLAALDRAGTAGIEIVMGSFELTPVTRANYLDLPMPSAGRIDTNRVEVMAKTRLAGSSTAAEQKLKAFVKALPRSGRGAVDSSGLTLTVINPDQYREAIVKSVAEDARHYASIFGPDYAVQVSGVDGQIAWSQVSPTEVFLYVPYRYAIVPK